MVVRTPKHYRLPEGLLDRLAAHTERTGLTETYVVEEALQQYLSREDETMSTTYTRPAPFKIRDRVIISDGEQVCAVLAPQGWFVLNYLADVGETVDDTTYLRKAGPFDTPGEAKRWWLKDYGA
jgi:hypothetical protein